MIHFVIILPFSRPANVQLIKKAFAEAIAGAKCKVSLYAICHTREHQSLWETSLLIQPPENWDKCYYKCNIALDTLLPHAAGFEPLAASTTNEDYFGFLCDDDTYEPGLFAAMHQQISPFSITEPRPEVIVISGRGWGNGPGVTVESEARPAQMRIGWVGLRQYFIRADVMRQFRFKNWASADGDIVERLWQRNRNGFRFLPHLWGNWNSLPA